MNDLAETITEQLGYPPPRPAPLRASGTSGADGVVIDLANAGPWATRQRWRPGEHRSEAEAALSLWEDACDEPGGELKAWGCAVSALIHALLDIGERL
jgi:hypothetical protein